MKLDGDIGPAGAGVLHHLTEVVPIDNASPERWRMLAQDVPGAALLAHG